MIPIQTTHVDDGVKMAYEMLVYVVKMAYEMLVYVGYDFTKLESEEMEKENDKDFN